MSQITAKVIEHSSCRDSKDLITLQLRYPRFIHSEFMTHRVFSRNASSSRAIPVAKMIEQVRTDPAMPLHWGANQAGMQAKAELQGELRELAIERWRNAAQDTARLVEVMLEETNLHKQVLNRLLEPFQLISVIVTATEWENFFELRNHPDAQPEIRQLAVVMLEAISQSVAVDRTEQESDEITDGGELTVNWHLPYVTTEERLLYPTQPRYLAKLSAARCARVSYLTHDGKTPDHEKDLELYERLVGGVPLHASPIEHQAYPDRLDEEEGWLGYSLHANFPGWCQLRKLVECEMARDKVAV